MYEGQCLCIDLPSTDRWLNQHLQNVDWRTTNRNPDGPYLLFGLSSSTHTHKEAVERALR